MNIGLFSADFVPNVGGIAAHVLELGRALARAGHSVHVITLPRSTERQPTSVLDGITVHRPRVFRSKLFFARMMRPWLRSFLAKTPLDVLHVHGIRPLVATKNLPVPVVFTNHSSGFLKRAARGAFSRRRVWRRLSHVAHVLAPSDELAAATKTVGYRGPVQFIPNGVDAQRFSPGSSDQRSRWGVADDETVILLARRLVAKNGVGVFAQAVTLLKSAGYRVIVAGDGPERKRIERILSNAGVRERCVLLGAVPNSLMPDIFRAADLSVLPSFLEATSITGLESMATGLPLVGTRVGGIPTLIADRETGLLVSPGNASELAAAMDTLVADSSLRKTMGQAARARAVEQFSWTSIARRTAAVYSIYARRAAA